VAPRTATEKAIAGIWAGVLGVERVGVEDDFFSLGGHSLGATQVLARIARLLEVEIPLRTMFETPTVAGLAAHVAEWPHTESTESTEFSRATR
jgi:acyl carrier protein